MIRSCLLFDIEKAIHVVSCCPINMSISHVCRDDWLKPPHLRKTNVSQRQWLCHILGLIIVISSSPIFRLVKTL